MKVAVVVPTKNRVDRVARLLAALDQQEGPDFEVVIVDDGSTDHTTARIESLADELTLTVRVIRCEESGGPARARNLGWRATDAEVVVLTDDDCVPAPKWLASLVAPLERGEADLVTGSTAIPDDEVEGITLWDHYMVDDGQRGHYSTSNIAYRREVLIGMGGFDEQFSYRSRSTRASETRSINGEDTDLAWRALEAGYVAAFAPDAVVYHDVAAQRWIQHVRNMRRLEGIVLLHKKHPVLRAHFGRRVFFRTEDLAVVGVAIGLLGLGSSRLRPLLALSVMGAAWHAYVCVRYRPQPVERAGYFTALPKAFAADAYGVLVMLRASLRYRTLLV